MANKLPERRPHDGSVEVKRNSVCDELFDLMADQQHIGMLSEYQCARLVVLLCIMNEWTPPKQLKGLSL